MLTTIQWRLASSRIKKMQKSDNLSELSWESFDSKICKSHQRGALIYMMGMMGVTVVILHVQATKQEKNPYRLRPCICCRLRAFLANPKGPPWTCPMVGPVGKAEVPEQFTCLEAKRQPSSTQQFPHFLPKKKGNHYNSLELTWTSTKALSSDFSKGSGHSFQPHSSTCSAHDAKQDSEETEQTPKWCWYTANAFCNMFINININIYIYIVKSCHKAISYRIPSSEKYDTEVSYSK